LDLVVLPSGYQAPVLPPISFDFRNRTEFDTLMELERYEQLMLDLYVAIQAAIRRSDLKGFIQGEDPARMSAILDRLIADETAHRDAVHSFVGQVRMIR
jgi:hypothetical protein